MDEIASQRSFQQASSLESRMNGFLLPPMAKKVLIGSIRSSLDELQNTPMSRAPLGGNLGGTHKNMPKFKDILGEVMQL